MHEGSHPVSSQDLVAEAASLARIAAALVQSSHDRDDRVPEPYRSTVRLHYFDGLTLREIAERQGVSHETARQRASRGIARLRERVERAAGRSWMAALIPLARARRPLAVSGGLVMSTVVK